MHMEDFADFAVYLSSVPVAYGSRLVGPGSKALRQWKRRRGRKMKELSGLTDSSKRIWTDLFHPAFLILHFQKWLACPSLVFCAFWGPNLTRAEMKHSHNLSLRQSAISFILLCLFGDLILTTSKRFQGDVSNGT